MCLALAEQRLMSGHSTAVSRANFVLLPPSRFSSHFRRLPFASGSNSLNTENSGHGGRASPPSAFWARPRTAHVSSLRAGLGTGVSRFVSFVGLAGNFRNSHVLRVWRLVRGLVRTNCEEFCCPTGYSLTLSYCPRQDLPKLPAKKYS